MHQIHDNNIAQLPTPELRRRWAEVWGIEPHRYIRREMLEKSLTFKMQESVGLGLSREQQAQLNKLVRAYRKDPGCFDKNHIYLKPGTRLSRIWKGKKYLVLVLPEGFEYESRNYSSLSEVASVITGTRWNGWVFFGLKKNGAA